MRFSKVSKVVKVSVVSMFLMAFVLGANAANESDEFNWSPVIDAIIHFESRGNANARNGQYAGVLQMSPSVVKAVNQILRSRGSKRRFTLRDRYNEAKSREMFVIFMSRYNPGNSVEKAIRMWKGGTGYSVRGTQRYYRTVMKYVNSH